MCVTSFFFVVAYFLLGGYFLQNFTPEEIVLAVLGETMNRNVSFTISRGPRVPLCVALGEDQDANRSKEVIV